MPAILEAVPGTMLALAGNPGRLSAALEREGAALGLRDQVRFLGYVPDDDLPALLSGASALVFPSLYEGFGLPPLEAMACGTPVITASAPAMTELLGGAAEFVPLRDPAAIAEAAIRFLTEPSFRADRSAAGLELANRFSWKRAAAETAEVYREIDL
jgi:glycosyltransferase involved in cell wall biosynthesis